jgi:hypothetical protein
LGCIAPEYILTPIDDKNYELKFGNCPAEKRRRTKDGSRRVQKEIEGAEWRRIVLNSEYLSVIKSPQSEIRNPKSIGFIYLTAKYIEPQRKYQVPMAIGIAKNPKGKIDLTDLIP